MGTIKPEDANALAKRIVAHHSFPGASHTAIERVLNKGEYRHLPHGSDLCVEGDLGDEVFFLVRGNITVLRRDIHDENRVLSDMTCPCVFGHMSVIDGSRRSATCRANGPVELVILHRRTLDLLITEGSVAGIALRRLLIASLCDQLCNANGFVRKIVLDTKTEAQTTPSEIGKTGTTDTPKTTDENDLRTLAVKLGGWESHFGDLVDYEDEIEIVMDEDQKRTLDARKKR